MLTGLHLMAVIKVVSFILPYFAMNTDILPFQEENKDGKLSKLFFRMLM